MKSEKRASKVLVKGFEQVFCLASPSITLPSKRQLEANEAKRASFFFFFSSQKNHVSFSSLESAVLSGHARRLAPKFCLVLGPEVRCLRELNATELGFVLFGSSLSAKVSWVTWNDASLGLDGFRVMFGRQNKKKSINESHLEFFLFSCFS